PFLILASNGRNRRSSSRYGLLNPIAPPPARTETSFPVANTPEQAGSRVPRPTNERDYGYRICDRYPSRRGGLQRCISQHHGQRGLSRMQQHLQPSRSQRVVREQALP